MSTIVYTELVSRIHLYAFLWKLLISINFQGSLSIIIENLRDSCMCATNSLINKSTNLHAIYMDIYHLHFNKYPKSKTLFLNVDGDIGSKYNLHN